jgi:uridine kinase
MMAGNAASDSAMNPRARLLDQLADRIAGLERLHPVRVAVDGPDAAGKTTLADGLAGALERRGRPVVRATVDDFQRPRAGRYQRGSISAEGYYYDAFDYDALCVALLIPLGPRGDRRYRTAAFDYRTDMPLDAPVQEAAADAVLICDGVFLLRPVLLPHWDVRICLQVDPAETLRRALARDLALFGSAEVVRQRYEQRYLPAQRLYQRLVGPLELADIVIDNNDPLRPRQVAPRHNEQEGQV